MNTNLKTQKRILFLFLALFSLRSYGDTCVISLTQLDKVQPGRHIEHLLPVFTTGRSSGRHDLVGVSKREINRKLEEVARDLVGVVANKASRYRFGENGFLTLVIRADLLGDPSGNRSLQSFIVTDAFVSPVSPRDQDYRDVNPRVAALTFQDIGEYPNDVYSGSTRVSPHRFSLFTGELIDDRAFPRAVDDLYALFTKSREIQKNPTRDSLFVTLPLDSDGRVNMLHLKEAVVSSATEGPATVIGPSQVNQRLRRSYDLQGLDLGIAQE